MLVLSRRLDEKFIFPTIEATVQVLSIKSGVVRLGIQAPPEVPVLREELQWRRRTESGPAPSDDRLRQIQHLVHKRLEITRLGLARLEEQLAAGRTLETRAILVRLQEEIDMLRQRLEGEAGPVAGQTIPSCAIHKALLVEDNPNERQLLAYFLRGAGIDVVTAGDGSDALNYLRAGGRPDVVLLDMALPRCDGATMVRTLRQDPAYAGLKIFAVTGHNPEEFGLALGAGGIDRWFHKPIDPVDLVRGVNQELEHATLSC